MKEFTKFLIIVAIFGAAYFLPVDSIKFQNAIIESLYMLKDYAQKHVLLCLVPAFFIAGAIGVFVSQAAVMKYLGAKANKFVAYSVASVSGTILAVCSCTVLPLFAGIYKMGAGLGPATAFLYSGPAINVLAIVLTAKVLGWEIGLARAVGSVLFAFVVGILMAITFREDEEKRQNAQVMSEQETKRSLLQDSIYFFSMVAILVFANWARPSEESGLWFSIFKYKWWITGLFAISLVFSLVKWFDKDEIKNWMDNTWAFAKQILPLLFFGVIVAGFLLGMPGTNNGIIPSRWIAGLVGGNSLFANFFAAFVGAFMYFATLTEVPILQGLLGAGMGKGPALALLLAGPALSLPNMLVIRSVLGTKKTIAYVSYVVILSTIAGIIFGKIMS